MPSITNTGFDATKDEVETLITAGERFEIIEETINRANLSGDEKSALWLLAWSEQPYSYRRLIVGEALASAATPN